MKGKKLLACEAREFENGTKFWVEDFNEFHKNQICIKHGNILRFTNPGDLSYWTIADTDSIDSNDIYRIRIYEWIDENTTKNLGGTVKMDKLKIELFRYENLVFGKVLGMDESLRGCQKLVSNSTFEIFSDALPALDNGKLYVRGNDHFEDDKIFEHLFESPEKAINICEYIKELVGQINEVKDEPVKQNVFQIL